MAVGHDGLRRYFNMADTRDLAEAMLAYPRYHNMMRNLSKQYKRPLFRVVAAFASLSPNSDYIGNLRSLVSVLEGMAQRVPPAAVTVSTYNHCKLRAWVYLSGRKDFERHTKGLKILNFYHNILYPHDDRWVTVDGHVVAAWRGADDANMKDSLLKPSEYETIKAALIQLAAKAGIAPNAYQAAVWFARKRHLNIKYSAQWDLFSDPSGITWDEIVQYPFKPHGQLELNLCEQTAISR